MARGAVVHLGKDLIVLHLVCEVAAVEFHFEDGFVEVLELGQGKTSGRNLRQVEGLEDLSADIANYGYAALGWQRNP